MGSNGSLALLGHYFGMAANLVELYLEGARFINLFDQRHWEEEGTDDRHTDWYTLMRCQHLERVDIKNTVFSLYERGLAQPINHLQSLFVTLRCCVGFEVI
jgi:hypothetical protein